MYEQVVGLIANYTSQPRTIEISWRDYQQLASSERARACMSFGPTGGVRFMGLPINIREGSPLVL